MTMKSFHDRIDIVLYALTACSALMLSSCDGLDETGWGKTANCYIVSSEGTYELLTVKGNSNESVGNVAYAEVLWESFGTVEMPDAGELIGSVSYADGKITYSVPAPFRTGNALIAAKDASGTVLWSWHIWLTEQPQEQVYSNGAGIMMDSNLGAISKKGNNNGLLYQWGRKDPFLGTASTLKPREAVSTGTWSFPDGVKMYEGSVDFATKNPTTYILGNPYSQNDWNYKSRNNDLWKSQKSIYDPCPAGWRVPDGGDNGIWAKATGSSKTLTGTYDIISGMNFRGVFGGDEIFYPGAGFRSKNNGLLDNTGSNGHYWSVTPAENGGGACYLHINGDGRVSHLSSSRAAGRSVRCMKE